MADAATCAGAISTWFSLVRDARMASFRPDAMITRTGLPTAALRRRDTSAVGTATEASEGSTATMTSMRSSCAKAGTANAATPAISTADVSRRLAATRAGRSGKTCFMAYGFSGS